ncbi:MAG: trypsin-like serine protease [Lachnospiraceae bacterium]|nr:trypsin-like serine protease [Lachnospiraceae bacterium]
MENNNTNFNSQSENNNFDSFNPNSQHSQEGQDGNSSYYEAKEENAYRASSAGSEERIYRAGVPEMQAGSTEGASTASESMNAYTAGEGSGQPDGTSAAQAYWKAPSENASYGSTQSGETSYGEGSSQPDGISYGNTYRNTQPDGVPYRSAQPDGNTYRSAQAGGASDDSAQANGASYGSSQPGGSYYQNGAKTHSPYGQENRYGQYPNGSNASGREQFYHTGQWNAAEGQEGEKASRRKKRQKASKAKKPHGFGMSLAKCAAIAVVFGLVSSTVFYGTGLAFEHTAGKPGASISSSGGNSDGVTVNSNGVSATSVSTATTVTDVSDIVKNVMPSIVSITNMGQENLGYDFFGRSYVQDTESAGSGIIIGQTDDEIYIATNNHVVAKSTQLTVNFIDNQTVSAEIKGTDSSTDLAVLSVPVKDIPSETMEKIKVATLGNSENLKVGEGAVAIGNALGYGQSVTTGVISALDREVTVQDDQTGASITNDLIQTSAAINPGNSGGALLNMNGEVIGINSVKYSDTQVEGMGFSIPISAAEPIINSLITRELVDESKSAYLGVSGQSVTEELAVGFGMPEGIYITLVQENSAAAQAGINKGDVMTEFDGRKVGSMKELSEIMQYYEAGTEVEITLQSNVNGEWQEKKITALLGKKNE